MKNDSRSSHRIDAALTKAERIERLLVGGAVLVFTALGHFHALAWHAGTFAAAGLYLLPLLSGYSGLRAMLATRPSKSFSPSR